jgi:AhpD family alkylhydroperoxidase
MARIKPVDKSEAGPVTRLNFRIAERMSGGKLPEPFAAMAHRPLLLNGYGAFELAFARSKKAPKNVKALAELKAAALAGCEWCMDYGSWHALREAGVTERQLHELPNFRDSDAFSEEEKLALEYAEGITRTPVDVSDELFARLRERFDEAEIVEITWAAAIENLRARFNWALGIASQDYSEGAVCVRPEALPAAAGGKTAG